MSSAPPVESESESQIQSETTEELEVTVTEHGGHKLGPVLWLHRFVYNSKREVLETRRKSRSTNDLLGSMGPVGAAQPSYVLDNAVSWSTLRSKLAKAKVTDALTNLKFEINGVTFTSLRIIGEGGYSTVYEVFDTDKTLRALKVVELTGLETSLKEDLLKEIEFLLKFRGSEHVIQLIDYEHATRSNGEESLYILMERGECDLSSILNQLNHKERLTPSKLRYFWEQMLESVLVVHEKGIVHADLKPSNFILVRGQLKLIDFGFAGELPPGEEYLIRDCVVGTKAYISPESFAYFVVEEGAIDWEAMKGRQYHIKVGYKSDIWALGVILHQLVYQGAAPFSGVPGGKLGKFKALIDPDTPVEFEPVNDPNLLETMRMCLIKNPEERADLQTLLKHPFLN